MTEVRASLRNSCGSSTWDIPLIAGEDILGGIFNKAVVSQCKWIFYNNAYTVNDGRSKIVNEGEGEGEIDLGFFVRVQGRLNMQQTELLCLSIIITEVSRR